MIALLLAQPLDPGPALDDLRAAYAEDAVADHMTYETRRSDGTFDRVTAAIRIDNAEHGRAIRYETSGFVFHADEGELIGASEGPPEPRRVLIVRRDAEAADLLTRIVPTGPLPQLWTGEGDAREDPALGVVRFTAAETDRGVTAITGASAFGEIRVETDADTGRLIRLRAALRDGSVELRASPIGPGDPAGWKPETEGRRAVGRIDQLAPNLVPLTRGDVLPNLHLLRPAGEGIELTDWHENPPDDAPRAPWTLVIFADATSRPTADALREAARTLRAIRDEADARREGASPARAFWLRFRPLVVAVLPEESALEADGPRASVDRAEVLYSPRPDLTIDRLPFAPIVAVAIDRDRVIGAIGAKKNGALAPSFVNQMLEPASNTGE